MYHSQSQPDSLHIDEKVNIVNDKVDEIHTQVKELDQRIGILENKVELNHVLVIKE